MFKIDTKKIEQTLGSLKFAVIAILFFSAAMIVGTFIESYYGTDFANRLIYKTPWFFLIQFCMLLSIIFAAFLRLPPQKRLYGFYTIHTGLVVIGMGSMITYIAGVDGNLYLPPKQTNRDVVLSKDVLDITFPDEGKKITHILPYSAFPTKIAERYENIFLENFIPFAGFENNWIQPLNIYPDKSGFQSSEYYFKNAFAEQNMVFSLHPEAANDFEPSINMGPLTVNYLPKSLSNCFSNLDSSGFIIWDTRNGECYTPSEKKIKIVKTKSNNQFIAIPFENKFLTFFPDFSPFPMSLDFKLDNNSPIRVLSLIQFQKNPTLFLFGNAAAFFSKDKKSWVVDNFKGSTPIVLPWMNAEISLIKHSETEIPTKRPRPKTPIQKNGQMISGEVRAVELNILGQKYWATNMQPLSLSIAGKKAIIEVSKEVLTLPFELTLTEFKMDKDPGTQNPASYESFVNLFDGQTNSKHHIYMNNPLKHRGFTFYQASYSETESGQYASTLSVNVDPGRPFKYFGSILLVLGSIWHFVFLKGQKKKAS